MDTTFYVGTSGYGYKEWKGSFYPNDLPARQMLRYYAERLGAVEMNNTFRRMPTASALAAVASEVPPGFQFAMKAPQQITHFRRLRDCAKPIEELLTVAKALKKHLGPLLFQLPPNFKKDLPRLREFLSLLPKRTRAAFEFRHASWFDEEVFELFRKRGVALCYAEEEESVEVPFVGTTDWGYLRLRFADYGDADLKRWIKRVRAQKWTDAFVFFKHEDEGKGPRFAKRFLGLASA